MIWSVFFRIDRLIALLYARPKALYLNDVLLEFFVRLFKRIPRTNNLTPVQFSNFKILGDQGAKFTLEC